MTLLRRLWRNAWYGYCNHMDSRPRCKRLADSAAKESQRAENAQYVKT